MERVELEVYSKDTNFAVIKPPGRQFPGAVIQGDSLSVLCSMVREIARSASKAQLRDPELVDNIEELNNMLISRLLHYQKVLAEHDLPFPYNDSFSKLDLRP